MQFSVFAIFLFEASLCFTCPKNWQYESSSGKCKQTNLALICTGDSVVVVAEVDDLYYNLPKHKESETRIRIGSCMSQTGPLHSRYVEFFLLNNCDPTVEADKNGIKATWEVTGTAIDGFNDVYTYSLSCSVKTSLEGQAQDIQGITDSPNLILESSNQNTYLSICQK